MVSCTWTGEFEDCLGVKHIRHMNLCGRNWEDICSQATEYVECLEDREDWTLVSTSITNSRDTRN